jgi:hypothetical protein
MKKVYLSAIILWSVAMNGREIKEGALYRHYKGGLYRVLRIAYNTGGKLLTTPQDVDDASKSVVYEPIEPHPSLGRVTWVRPYIMFNEMIVINNAEQYRFVECAE